MFEVLESWTASRSCLYRPGVRKSSDGAGRVVTGASAKVVIRSSYHGFYLPRMSLPLTGKGIQMVEGL